MEQEIKTCENCKYMRPHYAIGYDGTFRKLYNAADCTHGKVTKIQFKKYYNEYNVCQHWETCKLKQQENEQKLIEHLKLINNHLSRVIEVLESKDFDE